MFTPVNCSSLQWKTFHPDTLESPVAIFTVSVRPSSINLHFVNESRTNSSIHLRLLLLLPFLFPRHRKLKRLLIKPHSQRQNLSASKATYVCDVGVDS
jgi:hypothetical protein